MLRFNKKHASFEERNRLIAERLPLENSWVLDVGSNTGYTTKFLGDLGHYVLGVEKMEEEFAAAKKIQGETSAFMRVGVSPEFLQNGPHWSAILLLSVLHRIYAFEGEEIMRSVLSECAKKTDDLFIEGSTRHARYKDRGKSAPKFVQHDINSAANWHETMFSEVLGDEWKVCSKHVLKHTKKEPHRILFHLSKRGNISPTKTKLLEFKENQILEIDPADIGFIQFPEFHKMGSRAPGSIREGFAGDWDTVLDRECFWGARYEDAKKLPTGMVPLENYYFMTALNDHFLLKKTWQETQWYNWIVEKAPSRYNTSDKIEKRLQFLDQLYADCVSGNYRPDHNDLPLINVGRDGHISIEDGRHRICVAKVSGLARIPVKVNAVHSNLS